MKPTFLKFGSFGDSTSRYTWASVSSPLIARIEWPKAITMPTTPIKLSQLRRIAQRFGQRRAFAEPAQRIFLLAGDWIDQGTGLPLSSSFDCRRCRSHISGSNRAARCGTSLTGPFTPSVTPLQVKHDDGHHRRGDHDLQRLAARFVNAQQILPQEVQRDRAGDRHRAPVLDALPAVLVDMHAEQAASAFPESSRRCTARPTRR